MNNKEELKKQVIILSFILILVIIVAIILNFGKDKNIINNITTDNSITTEDTNINSNDTILNNLKGLQEEPTEEYKQDETQGTTENRIITQNGETIIVRE